MGTHSARQASTHTRKITLFRCAALLGLAVFIGCAKDDLPVDPQLSPGTSTSICATSFSRKEVWPFDGAQLARLLSELCEESESFTAIKVDDPIHHGLKAVAVTDKDGRATGAIVANYYTGNYEYYSVGWMFVIAPYIKNYSDNITVLRAFDVLEQNAKLEGITGHYLFSKFGLRVQQPSTNSSNLEVLNARYMRSDICRDFSDPIGTYTSKMSNMPMLDYDMYFGQNDAGNTPSGCETVYIPCSPGGWGTSSDLSGYSGGSNSSNGGGSSPSPGSSTNTA